MVMKILAFFDAHGRGKNIVKALDIHSGICDAVVFLGDGVSEIDYVKRKYPSLAYFSVKGNCDVLFCDGIPEETVVNLDGLKILILHGHKYGVKSGYDRILYRAAELEADAVLFGHTHIPFNSVEYVNGKRIQIFNPGSIASGSYGVLNTSHGIIVSGHADINEF